MKHLNKNSLLFVFVILFLIHGFSRHYIDSVKNEIRICIEEDQGLSDKFVRLKTNIDDISQNQVRYHDRLMDINSVRENLMGTRVIIKSDTTVVKADSGSLIIPGDKIDEEEIYKLTSRLKDLQDIAESNGAKLLYCAAPNKSMYNTAPKNINNYASENIDVFLKQLKIAGVPCLDLRVFLNANIEIEEMFYYTDHHWTTRSGFLAASAICEELNRLYGFEYNTEYVDISNYNVEKLPNWFLGSYGKKVGVFFTWRGADDFEVITPKFETYFTEERPDKNEVKTGTFEETVMVQGKLVKDYYRQNTYSAYSGGDFHLQIMRNNLNPDGKKILMIRDSFACVVAPFLALHTSELDVCDIRDEDYIAGERLNMAEYIAEIKPDYVIVLYSGVSTLEKPARRYDFSE